MGKNKKSLRRRIKLAIRRILIKFAIHTIPYLYWLYIRLVWMTSKVYDRTETVPELYGKEPYKSVSALWHQDVFCVAWGYRNLQPLTLASLGDAGEVISKILNLCKYKKVWRGGSSKSKKRHKKILEEFIAYFKGQKQCSAGITVDGSRGPAYRLKRGVIVIAKESHCPITISRIWCKRRIFLPTWDRTMVPLPFNKIILYVHGPYWPPEDLDVPEKFEQYRNYIENELLELTYYIFHLVDGKVPKNCIGYFPEGWQPSWPKNKLDLNF